MPENIISLNELIETGKTNRVNIENVSFFKNNNHTLMLCYMDYISTLKEKAVEIELTEDEFYSYRFQPRKLSEFLYKTGELFHLIMALNDIRSLSKFDKRKLKVLPPDENIFYDIIKNERKKLARFSITINN